MKKEETFMAGVGRTVRLRVSGRSEPRIVVSFGVTCMPGRRRCSPLDDDDVLRAQTACDHPQPVDEPADSHRTIIELRRSHRASERSVDSGRCRSRDPRRELASCSTLPSNCTRANRPGVKRPSLVLEHCARANRPGAHVDLVVDEIHVALVREAGLVGEAHAHGFLRLARLGRCPRVSAPGTSDRRAHRLRSKRRSDRPTRSW